MAKNYVDFKVTVWARAHFNDDADMDKVAEMLKNGATSNDVCDEDKSLGYTGEWETLLDTEVTLKPEQNEGNATIEVYQGDEPIFANGNNKL